MRRSKEDEMILSYKDVVLRQLDLDILNGHFCLNDRIIEFYFSYLSSTYTSPDILLVPPAISFYISNCSDSESLNSFIEPLKLPDKKIVIFTINDNEDFSEVGGLHWSLLAFSRSMNAFVHHDTAGGLNRKHAKKLYNAVKGFVAVCDSVPTSSKKRENKKAGCPTPVPDFIECSTTPQQQNGYDCGLYVMAIAKVICDWYENGSKDENWFLSMEKQVNSSIERTMRGEILKLIEDLQIREHGEHGFKFSPAPS
eukprot:TRINITY_DN16263_c0_g1_i1.p1 TRINITY_DN16263_c0_g1~~TRINITY_DN16263_c0_g1_i1.p1  ORF type:complete len:254 (+),score=45.22 TRINITY_DN16263_c0_g1_i1:438-1199(+)